MRVIIHEEQGGLDTDFPVHCEYFKLVNGRLSRQKKQLLLIVIIEIAVVTLTLRRGVGLDVLGKALSEYVESHIFMVVFSNRVDDLEVVVEESVVLAEVGDGLGLTRVEEQLCLM